MRIRAVIWTVGICVCVFAAVLISRAIDASLSKPDSEVVPVDTAAIMQDPLREFTLQQEQLRSLQLTKLDEIVNSENTSQDIRDAAQEEKLKILAKLEIERTVSGILQARGYSNAACSMGEDWITVMIRALELGEADAARITGLITTNTDLRPENIKIIPIN